MTAKHRDWREEVRRRLRDIPVTRERQTEIVEEVAQFLESRYDDLIQDGVDQELASTPGFSERRSRSGLGSRQGRRVRKSTVRMSWSASFPLAYRFHIGLLICGFLSSSMTAPARTR